MGALRDQVRHHAVHAHSRQQQGEGRKCAQHGAGEALAGQRIVQPLVHRADVVDRHAGIDSVNLADDGVGEVGRIRGGARHQIHPLAGRLLMREIHNDFAAAIEAILLDHPHHAGDRQGLLRIEPEMLANGIVARPETLRELFVDNRHLLAVARIVVVEIAVFQ